VCLKLHKKQAQRSTKKCNNLSNISPGRRVFEKTGVEIQRTKCCGHLDMTAGGCLRVCLKLHKKQAQRSTHKCNNPIKNQPNEAGL
jgi:hypothetical protein